MFIALAASYAYLMNKEVVYEYNLPYSSITAPDAGAFRHFLTLSDVPFSLNEKSKTLSLTSTNPNYEAVISSEAAIIGNKLTAAADEAADEANFILKLLKEDIPAQILNSEEAAKRYFNILITCCSNYYISFNYSTGNLGPSVVKTVKSPKVTPVLALSVVVGGMAGLFFIFLLRKEKACEHMTVFNFHRWKQRGSLDNFCAKLIII